MYRMHLLCQCNNKTGEAFLSFALYGFPLKHRAVQTKIATLLSALQKTSRSTIDTEIYMHTQAFVYTYYAHDIFVLYTGAHVESYIFRYISNACRNIPFKQIYNYPLRSDLCSRNDYVSQSWCILIVIGVKYTVSCLIQYHTHLTKPPWRHGSCCMPHTR